MNRDESAAGVVERVVRAGDGRALMVQEGGRRDGYPVLVHAGSPSSRHLYGLRIGEVLDLHEGDLEPGRGALLVRESKGGRRREVGMDDWGWEQLRDATNTGVTRPALES